MSICDFSELFLQSMMLCVATEIVGLFSLSSDNDQTKMSLNVWFQREMQKKGSASLNVLIFAPGEITAATKLKTKEGVCASSSTRPTQMHNL